MHFLPPLGIEDNVKFSISFVFKLTEHASFYKTIHLHQNEMLKKLSCSTLEFILLFWDDISHTKEDLLTTFSETLYHASGANQKRICNKLKINLPARGTQK